MALYVGDNEISQKILLKGNVGVQLPTMSSDTEGQYLSNDGIQPVWKNEQIGYKQISNCITEIPQDIKLEVNDGVLTLKTGSKLYKPDGTSFNTSNDISFDFKEYGTSGEGMIYLTVSGGMNFSLIENITSGTISPSLPANGRLLWFDTDTNIIKMYAPNSSEYEECYLPLGICDVVANTSCTIKQVFNGFGFIGTNAFILPGVKGLKANGLENNGLYKNIEVINSNVQICLLALASSKDKWTFFSTLDTNDYRNSITHYEQNYKPSNLPYETATWYNTLQNNFYYTNDTGATWVKSNYIGLFTYNLIDGIVSNFKSMQPIQLIARNDSSWIAKQAMPSKKAIPLTLGASGVTYVAPANGYFSIDGQGPNWVDVAIIYPNLNYGYCFASRSSDKYCRITVPVSAGSQCQILFDTAFTNLISFNFIYAEGEL